MDDLTACCAHDLPPGVVARETWIKLMSAGDIAARDGRAWKLTDAAAVVAASLNLAAGADLPIDYEHQTDYAAGNGQPAPAAGWIRELSARNDGIWARVEWTDRACQMLNNREYRYISPTFQHTKSGVVQQILRAALTNNPALDLPALAKSQPKTKEDHMQKSLIEKILAKLKLSHAADESQVDQALAALDETAPKDTLLARLASTVGLADTAEADELVAKVTALAKAKTAAASRAAAPDLSPAESGAPQAEPPPDKYVPREEFDRIAKALATLQTEQTTARATAAVDAAVNAGKITPATRSWATSYATADAEGFARYVAAAPVIVQAGSTGINGVAAGKNKDGLDADEVAVCQAMGITPKQFQAANPTEEVTA